MDEDNSSALLAISLVIFIVVGGIGAFFLGRSIERRALTHSLVVAIEKTYQEGFDDGQLMGRKQGMEIGAKNGYDKCLNDDYKLKDNY